MSDGVEGLKMYLDLCQSQLNDLILVIRGKLSKQNRITLGMSVINYFNPNINILLIGYSEALVTLDIHGKDALTDLWKMQVTIVNDFNWLCHLRYYWRVSSSTTLQVIQ